MFLNASQMRMLWSSLNLKPCSKPANEACRLVHYGLLVERLSLFLNFQCHIQLRFVQSFNMKKWFQREKNICASHVHHGEADVSKNMR